MTMAGVTKATVNNNNNAMYVLYTNTIYKNNSIVLQQTTEQCFAAIGWTVSDSEIWLTFANRITACSICCCWFIAFIVCCQCLAIKMTYCANSLPLAKYLQAVYMYVYRTAPKSLLKTNSWLLFLL